MITEARILAVQCELLNAGRPSGYYDAVRELGRRGGRARAARMRRRQAEPVFSGSIAAARSCLPPGDRD